MQKSLSIVNDMIPHVGFSFFFIYGFILRLYTIYFFTSSSEFFPRFIKLLFLTIRFSIADTYPHNTGTVQIISFIFMIRCIGVDDQLCQLIGCRLAVIILLTADCRSAGITVNIKINFLSALICRLSKIRLKSSSLMIAKRKAL